MFDYYDETDHKDSKPEPNPYFVQDEKHGNGHSAIAAQPWIQSGEIVKVGIRNAKKGAGKGVYLCMGCVGMMKAGHPIKIEDCSLFPWGGPGTTKALVWHHYPGSVACRDNGDTFFHTFFCEFLAEQLDGSMETNYSGTNRRSDVYEPSTGHHHEVIVSSEVSSDKSADLRAYYEKGGVIYKWYPEKIDESERLSALDAYQTDPSPMSIGRAKLYSLLHKTRILYVPREVKRSNSENKSDEWCDDVNKTTSIDKYQRCGSNCKQFKSIYDDQQIRLTEGFCDYGRVGHGGIVNVGDICIIRMTRKPTE
jgi:hypothetical protein